MEGLPLIVVVTWLVHQYVLNGCCVAGFGLFPGTPRWAHSQSPCLHGACSLEGTGQWTSFHSLARFPGLCVSSPFYHLAHVLSSLLGSSQSKPCDLGQSHGALICWLIKWKYLLVSSPCKASERISEVGGLTAQPLGTAGMPSAGH